MARIFTQTITLKFSKLVRDGDPNPAMLTEKLIGEIESAASALADDGVVVEVTDISSEE